MKKLVVRVLTLFFIAAALLASLPAFAAEGSDLNTLVSTERAAWTPQIDTGTWNDGNNHEVWDYETVGNGVLVACGKFTQARATDGDPWQTRNGVFAFSTKPASRGQLTSFAPSVKLNGGVAVVNKCDLSFDKKSLIIAGSFNSVNGQTRNNLAKVSLATGALEDFAQTNGAVTDVAKAKGRYFLFGSFSEVNGASQTGIATISKSGAFDPYFHSKFAGEIRQNSGGTKSYRGVVTQNEKYLAAIVNVDTIDGKTVRHVAAWNLGANKATLRNWQLKPAYDARCQSYMVARDVTVMPGTNDLLIVSTGGPRGGICDRVVRAPLTKTGQRIVPTWINKTCGDTLHAVAATSKAIYAQGHQKCSSNVPGPNGTQLPRHGIHALGQKGNLLKWRSDQEKCVGGKALYVLNEAGYPKGLLSGIDCGTGIIFRPAV